VVGVEGVVCVNEWLVCHKGGWVGEVVVCHPFRGGSRW
jgi:hypothetical protein